MANPVVKAMRRMSPAGSNPYSLAYQSDTQRKASGFTIVELLIVITILAIVAAVMAPMLSPSPTRELRATASEIATTLRETRRHAQAKQIRQRFLMDTETGQYGLEDSERRRWLPEGMAVEMTTAESLQTGDTSGGIDFFPDGSSTGGRLVLSIKDLALQVDIEWLTGRIRVAENTR